MNELETAKIEKRRKFAAFPFERKVSQLSYFINQSYAKSYNIKWAKIQYHAWCGEWPDSMVENQALISAKEKRERQAS
jgi:hypothetical protein